MTKIIKLFAITTCFFASFNAYASSTMQSCRTGGCNSEICESALGETMSTICEIREEYACYKTAKCERQEDGKCGWTMSKELEKCLSEKRIKNDSYQNN